MEEAEEDDWVEEEIEKELEELGNLSLQDLEEEELGCHDNKSPSPLLPAVTVQSADITPLFHDYFIALQSAQLHSQEIISDAEKILSSVTRTDGERIMLNAIAGNASQSSAERSDELHTENVCIENVETGSESCAENRNDKGGDADIVEEEKAMCVREEVNSEDVEVNITDLQSLKEKQIRELEEEQHRREEVMDKLISRKESDKKEHDKILVVIRYRECAVQTQAATTIQANVRGWISRRVYVPKLEERKEKKKKWLCCQLTHIQAHARGYLVRCYCARKMKEVQEKRRVQFRSAVCYVQAQARGYLIRKKYLEQLQLLRKRREQHKKLVILIPVLQANCRGYLLRKYCKPKIERILEERNKFEVGIVKLQANIRRYLTKKQYSIKLKKARRIGMKDETLPCIENSNEGRPSLSDEKEQSSSFNDEQSLLSEIDLTSELVAPPVLISSTPSKTLPHTSTTLPSSLPGLSTSTTLPSSVPGLSAEPAVVKCRISSKTKQVVEQINESDSRKVSVTRELSENGSKISKKFPASVEGLEQDEDEVESLLAVEEKALQELQQTRRKEMAVAQLARERMTSIFSAQEISFMADRERQRTSYQKELEHSSSPLLATAWVGIVEERMAWWKAKHSPKREPCSHRKYHQPTPDYHPKPKTTPPTSCPLTGAQLLAASPKGTHLDDVVEVVVYRSRSPVDLSCLHQCPKLWSITLNHCGIETLTSIKGCPQLTQINMLSNEMKHIALHDQRNLCFMDLSDNHLTSIHGMEHTNNLLHLMLSGNRITRVTGVTGCPQLRRLILDSNLLINCKGLEELSELEYLSCCENHLPSVDGLSQCHLLQHLLLSQNNLQQVPSLFNLVLLRELRLEENSISSLTTISDAWLPLLQTLSLANNCISQLSSLTCLVMLKALDVSNNSIYDLPVLLQALRGCYGLKELFLSGNPVTGEKKLCSYLLKTVPSLEKLEGEEIVRHSRKFKLPEAIATSNVYVTCQHQIAEQDQLRHKQRDEIERLTKENEGSPQGSVNGLKARIKHCQGYHKLLCQHLQEQENLAPGKWSLQNIKQQQQQQPPLPPFSVTKAVVLIQSFWRGVCGRRVAAMMRKAKEQREMAAATSIQALFRGYRLRKKLCHLLKWNETQVTLHCEGKEEEFDYDQEIVLDFLDEDMLKAGMDPLSPKGESEMVWHEGYSEAKKTAMMPAFTIPGAPETYISYEEWKEQTQPNPSSYHQQTTPSPTPSHLSHSTSFNPSRGHVQEAWGSSTQIDHSQPEHEMETSKMKEEDIELTKKQAISHEWGFSSAITAHLMLKKVQRQKQLHCSAARRRKLADPSTRLARFKRQENATSNCHPPRWSSNYYHAASQNSVRPPPSPTLSELSAKEHIQYQWVHGQKVVHNTTVTTQSCSLLPHIEPHVLAGHTARLVSSDAQNRIVGTENMSGVGHTHNNSQSHCNRHTC